ncbi:hypothetical protein ACLBXM_19880 [Xanthobacteraceae bacterium A53D]
MARRTPSTATPSSAGLGDDAMILALGLQVGALASEVDALDEKNTRTTDKLVEIYAQGACDHAFDRLLLTRSALASHRGTSLKAAAIQAAAAIDIAGNMLDFRDAPDIRKLRELERLLCSVCDVLQAHVEDDDGLWPARYGVEHMSNPHRNPWRDLDERIEMVRG